MIILLINHVGNSFRERAKAIQEVWARRLGGWRLLDNNSYGLCPKVQPLAFCITLMMKKVPFLMYLPLENVVSFANLLTERNLVVLYTI